MCPQPQCCSGVGALPRGNNPGCSSVLLLPRAAGNRGERLGASLASSVPASPLSVALHGCCKEQVLFQRRP